LTEVATIRASDLANGTASWGFAKALRVVALPPVFRMRSHESKETFVPYFVRAELYGKEYMPNAVMHFEIYAEHPATLADFYQGLFWWTINKAPGIDYYMIQTAPTDARGISGGLTYRPIPEPRSWVHYVSVESLDQTIESVPPQVCSAKDGLVCRRG